MPTELSAGPNAASGNSAMTFCGFACLRRVFFTLRGFASAARLLAAPFFRTGRLVAIVAPGSRLARDQRALAFDSPAVPRQRAVEPHHAMARYRDRDGIRAYRLRDCAHRLRCADAARDLSVARWRAGRSTTQRLPSALLKSRAANVEREIETIAGSLDQADDASDEPLEFLIAAHELRLWKTVLQTAHERFRVVAQRDRADAA